MERSLNKSRYGHALLTTLVATAVHPFIMAFLDSLTANVPFSMNSAWDVAKSDTPFFFVVFAIFNFGMAWFSNRRDAKKG